MNAFVIFHTIKSKMSMYASDSVKDRKFQFDNASIFFN